MRSRFDEQLAELNKELIEMGALCELKYPSRLRTHDLRTSSSCSLASSSRIPEK